MMERWDTGTAAARALATLASLRRRSLAVQRGFTRELHVGHDVFAFARGYGRSAIVVVLNRGARASLKLEGTLLPDGLYPDLLGVLDAPVCVSGEALTVEIPKDAAIVLEHHAPIPEGRARVVLRLNGYGSRYGERMVVMGDAPELGRWDPERAAKLHYVNNNLWTGDLVLHESAGTDILYRFAVIDAAGAIRHEDRLPRQRRAPDRGVVSWKDRWAGP